MPRFINNTAALVAALLITLASLNAVVTVPPVDVANYSASILA